MTAALVVAAIVALWCGLYRLLRWRERTLGERMWNDAARERARRDLERELANR